MLRLNKKNAMKNTTKPLKTNLLLTLLIIPLFSISQSVATYSINFNSIWNSTDHGTLPDNAHWSRLVGANHNSNVTFLEMGGIATPGIEDVAEKGDNDIFMEEIGSSITAGNAEQYIDGGSLSTATGNINIAALEVSEDFPLLTLVSMIAPSPDWMIAVNSVELRENDAWKNSISIDLYPYDAGTDSGANYTSGNDNTNPQEPISSLQGVAPFNNEKIGTLTITLQNVLGIEENSLTNNFKMFPNPSNGNITIKNSKSDINEILIYNVIGNQVYQQKNIPQQANLNLKHLNSGIYMVKIVTTDDKTITKKLILDN